MANETRRTLRTGGERSGLDLADLPSLLDRVQGRSVLVYGDLVCDVYLHTKIDRVSREAPVLIVHHGEREMRAGGAANAARNVASLGGRALPVGFVGEDPEGGTLRALMAKDRNPAKGVLVRPQSETPIKTRILASAHHGVEQQVLRVDKVQAWTWSGSVEAEVRAALEEALATADAVLVSDYGLGTVEPAVVGWLFEQARAADIPRLVDSRHRLQAFPGATLAAPNEPEMEELAGRPLGGRPEDLAQAAERLRREMKLEALVVTQGSEGMNVIRAEEEPVRLPVFGKDEVADVTGAGDTVAAALALALAAGADPVEAARLATVAAGLAVMKMGTATVTAEEVRQALRAGGGTTEGETGMEGGAS